MKKAEEAAAKYGSAEAEEVAVANPGKVITHPDEVEGDTRLSVAAERTAAKIAAKNNPQTACDLPATVIALFGGGKAYCNRYCGRDRAR